MFDSENVPDPPTVEQVQIVSRFYGIAYNLKTSNNRPFRSI
jgi:hypothetical protein